MPETAPDPSLIDHLRKKALEVAAATPEPSFYRNQVDAIVRSDHALRTEEILLKCRDLLKEDHENLGHGAAHALLVARDAGALMEAECHRIGIDAGKIPRLVRAVQIAGLLHDIRRSEKNHALAGAAEVARILPELGLPPEEAAWIVTAIRNHEAFKPTVEPETPEAALVSDVLYDADKFRWGPDNFTDTLWLMMRSAGGPTLEHLHRRFLQNLDYIRRIKPTFRTEGGKHYGPDFIDIGIGIGKSIYRELSERVGGWRMELITDLEQVAGCCSPRGVVTLGNFDGLHVGHQVLVRQVVARARELDGSAIVFTFHPHPLKVLAPKACPPLISSYEEKVALFEELGIDFLLMIPFTREIAEMSAWDFAEKVLKNTLNAVEVFVGFNYRFGRDREGNVDRLREYGKKLGFTVNEVREVAVDGEVVSSTKIRDLLRAGDVEHAAKLLGRPYAISGRVVKGDQRGRTLGFPTANIDPVHEIMPYPGVYAVRAFVDGRQYDGVANAGFRPTFDKKDLCLEAHLFDFKGDLYGKEMTLFFVHKIRNEKRFDSLEALVEQIHRDAEEARRLLRHKA